MKLKLILILMLFCLDINSLKIDYKINFKNDQKALADQESCAQLTLDFFINSGIPNNPITLTFRNSNDEFVINGQTNNDGNFVFSINAAVLLAKINCDSSCKDFVLEAKIADRTISTIIRNNFCAGCTFPLDNLDLTIIEKYK